MNSKKSTLLLNRLKREPLSYSDMQRFLKSLEKTPTGYRLARGWRKRTDQRGYWCTNITDLIHMSKVIEKGADGKYHLTPLGEIQRKKPFSHRSGLPEMIRAAERRGFESGKHSLSFALECLAQLIAKANGDKLRVARTSSGHVTISDHPNLRGW